MDEAGANCLVQQIRDVVSSLTPSDRQNTVCVRLANTRKDSHVVRVENADGIDVGRAIGALPPTYRVFVRNPVATGETGARLDIYIPITAKSKRVIGSGSLFFSVPTSLVLWTVTCVAAPACRFLVC